MSPFALPTMAALLSCVQCARSTRGFCPHKIKNKKSLPFS
jgi:hypothetical protein